MKKLALPLVTALALTVPAAAAAHVTLQPPQVPADSYAVLDVRVPNETDDTNTTKVDVQFPEGFLSASTQPVPGWRARVITATLADPVKQHGEQITERVDRVVFTATGAGVAPGEFQDFPLSLKLPAAKAGTLLSFKALQTYSDGQVVRWIGSPDADRPAPLVTLTAAQGEHGATVPRPASVAGAGDDGSGGGGDGLAVVALVVAIVGLLAGGLGLVTARRARPA